MLRKIIKNILPFYFVNLYKKHCENKTRAQTKSQNNPVQLLYNSKLVNSFSQVSEDLLIDAILNKEKGFYIDIGANDPKQFSNTKRFYDKGWNGINIDPNPNCIKNFKEHRDRDINLNFGVSNIENNLIFYELTYSGLSSFSKETAISNCKNFNVKIEKEYNVEVFSLSYIFEKYVESKHVDFLSIDTEGYEMEVLKGNNWNLYRPTLIIFEIGQLHSEIYHYLIDKDYSPVFRNYLNAIFLDTKKK